MSSGFLDDFIAMVEELLTKEFPEYENLGLTSNVLERLRLAVVAFFAAFIVAAFVVTFNRGTYGGLVGKLEGFEAYDRDKAKTLKELGYENNPVVKSALKRGRKYRGLVVCVEEEDFRAAMEAKRAEYEAADTDGKKPKFKEIPFKFDFNTARFYIPEAKSYVAERRFRKNGSGVLPIIFIMIISLIGMFVALFYLPDLFQYLDNFIGIVKG